MSTSTLINCERVETEGETETQSTWNVSW